MIDVAIVGAGLCGLALARELLAQGREVQVFEARDRVGGRVLTRRCPHTGAPLDLGPTWYWPGTEPRIAALISSLGLDSLAQHDAGQVLELRDAAQPPEALAREGVHGGARRLRGGAASLVDALAAALPAHAVRTGLALVQLTDRGSHVELGLRSAAALPQTPFTLKVEARHLVLAMPARLVLATLRCEPPLPDAVREALQDTPTWMATQAKSLVSFATPFWRERGASGQAFVTHAQAVLGEIFDASPDGPDGRPTAGVLGGFSALSAGYRASVGRSLALLVDSQWPQVFGPQAVDALHRDHHDWAQDPWTCSALDLSESESPAPPMRPPGWGDPLLRRPLWEGRLQLAGTETATTGAGHMEGALDAAARVLRSLRAGPGPADSRASLAPGEAAWQAFVGWVREARAQAPASYRAHLHQRLATQRHGQMTQQALLATVEQVYAQALAHLDRLALPPQADPVSAGRHPLTPVVLAPFSGFAKTLVDEALGHNARSCALSHFPDEAHPGPEDLEVITRDLAMAWREFALGVNTLLLARSEDTRSTA